MVAIKIDAGRCIRDGLCSNICPLQIILPPEEGMIPQTGPEFARCCIKCGHCVAICPTGALRHSFITPEQCITNLEPAFDLESFERCLRRRRSTRRFKDRLPEKETLERLIGLTAYAPSGHNLQAVRWQVYRCRNDLATMVDMVCDWMKQLLSESPDAPSAPLFRKIIKDRARGGDFILHHAPILIIAHSRIRTGTEPTDAAIALSYIDCAAPGLGLGCCWAGLFKMAVKSWKPLLQFLDLPQGHHLHEALIIGYPKYVLQRVPPRKQPEIKWS